MRVHACTLHGPALACYAIHTCCPTSLPRNCFQFSTACAAVSLHLSLPSTGTGLQSLRLDARAGFKHALQLASSALPPSLTRLQLSGVAVTDSFGQALQITPHGVPWAGPTLQLPQLKELLLGGVSTSTPGTAFR
jgi:hypothetical protein